MFRQLTKWFDAPKNGKPQAISRRIDLESLEDRCTPGGGIWDTGEQYTPSVGSVSPVQATAIAYPSPDRVVLADPSQTRVMLVANTEGAPTSDAVYNALFYGYPMPKLPQVYTQDLDRDDTYQLVVSSLGLLDVGVGPTISGFTGARTWAG